MKINVEDLTRKNEEYFELPMEVYESIRLPQNRNIFTNVSPELIGNNGDYTYDLILKEGNWVVGRYNAQSISYSPKNSSLNRIYSLFSAKPRTKIPFQLLGTFSNLQQYLSSANNIQINHFAPISTKSKKVIPGIIKILTELSYEKEHPTEPFYGKTYISR